MKKTAMAFALATALLSGTAASAATPQPAIFTPQVSTMEATPVQYRAERRERAVRQEMHRRHVERRMMQRRAERRAERRAVQREVARRAYRQGYIDSRR